MKFVFAFLMVIGAAFAQDAELANYRSAVRLAFGVGDGSDRGTAYAEEYFYHDKMVYDAKVVYIKDNTTITATNGTFVPGNWLGSTALPSSGSMKYRLDQDMSAGRMWSNNNSQIKIYTAPLTFATMTLPDGTSPVGVTGPVPGVTQSHDNKASFYWRGSTDAAGNEYHTMQWCGYVALSAVGNDSDYKATDGKMWVFCVNPKTPCLTVRATGNGQFYTTPIKNYHIPKIFEQTTYFNAGTGTVTFELRNLYSSDVRYRINGGSWVDVGANNVTLDQDDFIAGTNTLDYYYEGNEAHVKTRTIVKNPTHPSLAETHGDLLWGASDVLTRHRTRRAIAGSVDALHWSRLRTNKNYNRATTANVKSGSRIVFESNGVLTCAFMAHEFGITAAPSGSGIDSTRSWATHAKIQLFNSKFRLDPVGLEIQPSGWPIPTRELKDRGYYVVGQRGHLMETLAAYDILVSIYRSDQHGNGITPIEDYLLRDWFAKWQVFNSCELGFYYNGTISATNMWERCQYMLSAMITKVLSTYSTPHGGTSGWDGNTTVYEDIPFPDVGHTWKSLFIDEDHEIPGYPNPHQRARYDNLFTPDGSYSATDNILIGYAWADRISYANQTLAGMPVGIFGNFTKLHTGKTYNNFFNTIPRGKIGQLYAQKKDDGESIAYYGPIRWDTPLFNNSRFPQNSANHNAYFLGNTGLSDNALAYNYLFSLLYWDTTYAEDTEPEADTTPPTLTSATVNAQGNRLTLVYSEDVEDVDPAHYSLSTGNTLSALNGVGNTWQFTIASPIVVDADVPTLSYTSGAGRTADVAGNLLATIAARAVVNNSLETTPVPPRAGRRGRGANVVPAGR